MEAGGSGEGWTEERHASFISAMEDSFVSRMIDRRGAGGAVRSGGGGRERRRMDRWVPDSPTESTCNYRCAGYVAGRKAGSARSTTMVSETLELVVRSCGMKRKPSSLPYDASGDQVVPEVEIKRCMPE